MESSRYSSKTLQKGSMSTRSSKDITKILRSLKPDKASGPDQVPSEFWKNALQNLLVHYAVSSDSALQTVLSQTNGRLPLSSQFTREIPSLIQLSTGQFPCWASLARWWNLRSTSSFRITCSPISWSLADNLASDHIIAPPTFSPSLHRLGMHL